jgi:hypothetical protein
VSELVRVARDGSAIIIKTDDGYVRTSADGTGERETSSRLSVLTAGGGWRRTTPEDIEQYAAAAVVAAGKVFIDEGVEKPKIYRVPPTVQRSIRAALDDFGPLLSETDRAIAGRLATQTQVDRADVEWLGRFHEATEKAIALHGGRRGQSWAQKVLADDSVAASAASNPVFEEEDVLFVAGADDDGEFETLYMVDPTDGSVYIWEEGGFVPTDQKDGEVERDLLVELDPETAALLAEELDGGRSVASLADLNPEERNLFDLAESEMDFEYLALVADATGYSPVERSVNAQRQPRGPGGRFGQGSPAPKTTTLQAYAKAHLPADLPLVEDPKALLEQYLADVTGEVVDPDDEKPIVAATEPGSGVEPLYLAVVDSTDKTAVLDVIAVVPDENKNPTGWRREGGKWVADQNVVADLQGDTPPPLVQLTSDDMVAEVLVQVDASDGSQLEPEATPSEEIMASAAELKGFSSDKRDELAKRGYALPDGSFPIENESDLENAVRAYGRAKDKDAARKHIRKRARALNRTDLIPDDWKNLSVRDEVVTSDLFGPYGEVIVAAGVPGVADTPEDFRNVERLKRYWTVGPGGAKIRWGTKGDLTRAHRYLMKYLKSSEKAWGMAQNLHKRMFGVPNATHDKAVGH